MKAVFLPLLVIFFVVSCSGLPRLDPVDPSLLPAIRSKCAAHFPKENWRFVHSIETTMPNGQKSIVIGVNLIYAQAKTIQSLIMTIEGLVIFDARHDQNGLTIHRAIPPFDSKKFARGLMNDVKLMFLKPDGRLIEVGAQTGDIHVCRYRDENQVGSIVDIVVRNDHSWSIRQYSKGNSLTRSIDTYACKASQDDYPHLVPCRIELTAHGALAYTLYIELLEAEPF
jgi:hypothetical protein